MSEQAMSYTVMRGCCPKHGEFRGAVSGNPQSTGCPTCGRIVQVLALGRSAHAAEWALLERPKAGPGRKPGKKKKVIKRPSPRVGPIAPPKSIPEARRKPAAAPAPVPAPAAAPTVTCRDCGNVVPITRTPPNDRTRCRLCYNAHTRELYHLRQAKRRAAAATPPPAIAKPAAAADPPLKRCSRCQEPIEPGSNYPSQPYQHKACQNAAARESRRKRRAAAATPPPATPPVPTPPPAPSTGGIVDAPVPVLDPHDVGLPMPAGVTVRFRLEIEGDAAALARISKVLREAFA